MSSIYRVLCLSHDPALVHGEYRTSEEVEAAVSAGVDGHPHCDLLIGRYSYPLVEVGCPATAGSERVGRYRCYPHANTEWVDAVWLRVLAAAHQSGIERMLTLASETRLAHWPWERLRPLRDELGIDL